MLTIGPWQPSVLPDTLSRSDTVEGEVAMIGAVLMRAGITRAFRAMSRKDHEAILRLIDPDVVLEYPGRENNQKVGLYPLPVYLPDASYINGHEYTLNVKHQFITEFQFEVFGEAVRYGYKY